MKTPEPSPGVTSSLRTPKTNPARRLLLAWLPVALWMALIFGFSTDAGSSRRTSRIIGPILRWIYPGISDEVVAHVQFGIRKGAHLTEYAILATLAWRALRLTRPAASATNPWNHRHALAAIVIAGLFAAGDEWHQSTVPSRQGQFSDVLIDTTGACAGMILVWGIGRRLRRW